MGLDFRLYRIGKEITEKEYENSECDRSIYTFQILDRWESRNTIFKNKAYYTVKECLYDGRYSYSTHSRLRDYLAELSNLDCDWKQIENYKSIDTPFYYLFDFGDNEGCFDYYIGHKLLKDFEQFADKNKESKYEYMKQLYNEWCNMLKQMTDKDLIYFY